MMKRFFRQASAALKDAAGSNKERQPISRGIPFRRSAVKPGQTQGDFPASSGKAIPSQQMSPSGIWAPVRSHTGSNMSIKGRVRLPLKICGALLYVMLKGKLVENPARAQPFDVKGLVSIAQTATIERLEGAIGLCVRFQKEARKRRLVMHCSTCAPSRIPRASINGALRIALAIHVMSPSPKHFPARSPFISTRASPGCRSATTSPQHSVAKPDRQCHLRMGIA